MTFSLIVLSVGIGFGFVVGFFMALLLKRRKPSMTARTYPYPPGSSASRVMDAAHRAMGNANGDYDNAVALAPSGALRGLAEVLGEHKALVDENGLKKLIGEMEEEEARHG